MSRAQFLELTGASTALALVFAEVLADQLASCRTLLGGGFDPVKLRVAKVFLDYAMSFGTTSEEPGRYVLDTHLTHEDVAALVTATRVAVSKAVGELEARRYAQRCARALPGRRACARGAFGGDVAAGSTA